MGKKSNVFLSENRSVENSRAFFTVVNVLDCVDRTFGILLMPGTWIPSWWQCLLETCLALLTYIHIRALKCSLPVIFQSQTIFNIYINKYEWLILQREKFAIKYVLILGRFKAVPYIIETPNWYFHVFCRKRGFMMYFKHGVWLERWLRS